MKLLPSKYYGAAKNSATKKNVVLFAYFTLNEEGRIKSCMYTKNSHVR